MISCDFTEAIEPTKSLFLTTPYPTTTTSSKAWASSTNTTSTVFRKPTDTSCVTYPIYEKIRVVFPSGTDSEYLPSKSVIAPTEVFPFTTTFTPIKGSCLLSVTVPVIVLSCAKAHCTTSITKTKHKYLTLKFKMFFISLLLVNK